MVAHSIVRLVSLPFRLKNSIRQERIEELHSEFRLNSLLTKTIFTTAEFFCKLFEIFYCSLLASSSRRLQRDCVHCDDSVFESICIVRNLRRFRGVLSNRESWSAPGFMISMKLFQLFELSFWTLLLSDLSYELWLLKVFKLPGQWPTIFEDIYHLMRSTPRVLLCRNGRLLLLWFEIEMILLRTSKLHKWARSSL